MTMTDTDLQRMNKVLRHRLRNFASGIKSTVSFLSKELAGRLEPSEMEYFPLILNECEGLSELTARFNLLFDDVPPGGEMLVGDVVKSLATRLHDRFPTSALRMDVSDAVSALTLPREQYVALPLLEVLVNAAEAAPAKEIVLSGGVEHGELVFRVADQGPGLAKDVTEDMLFQPFVTSKARHLGMGLAIAARLVGWAGGKMTVVRRAEGGLQFELRIPSSRPAAEGVFDS